jgi:coenzyme F420-reducing hydrogenase alpha subunit
VSIGGVKGTSMLANYITKIEGHGKLKIDFEKNKAKLIVDEGERYFEALVLNRPYQDIPFIVSRICGVCPTSHYLASLKAIESAFNVRPSDTSINMRKILLLGQIAQSHILHTAFLALPDYINVDQISDIARKCPAEFNSAIKIKTISDSVVEIIGGRAVHPVTPTVGGFTKFPSKKELLKLRESLENGLEHAINFNKFFSTLEYPKFQRQTKYLALYNDNEYAFYEGNVMSNFGYSFPTEKYRQEIKEKVIATSSAKNASYLGKSFMVGSLARMSIHANKLSSRAKHALDAYFLNENFPSYNPFHNNIAQTIEIIHAFEEMIELIDKVIKSGLNDSLTKFNPSEGSGVGAIEAPRGTLYHYYKIDKNGIITDCDIITPTVQNLANLEDDAQLLMEETKSFINKKRAKQIEMLVRAYDPCITCSVH